MSEKGQTVALECEKEFIGPLLRRCGFSGQWEDINKDYCLPKYPPQGKSHIDFIYLISHAHDYVIIKKPEGLITAMKSVYPILQKYNVGIYHVSKVNATVWFIHSFYF